MDLRCSADYMKEGGGETVQPGRLEMKAMLEAKAHLEAKVRNL